MHIVGDGDYAILATNDGKQAFAQIRASGSAKLHKKQVALQPLVGAPYGAVFEIKAGGLVRASRDALSAFAGRVDALTDGLDNSTLVDDNSAQKLTQEEINKMKGEVDGAEIIKALVSNSATFQGKTEFSREKYIKKKTKKYLHLVRVIRPNARTICESYFAKAPFKICNLRVDSLSLMLAMANVRAGCQALVVETASGVVIGAVAERVAGHAPVLCGMVDGSGGGGEAVRYFNLSKAGQDSIHMFPLSMVEDAKKFAELEEPVELESAAQVAVSAADGHESNERVLAKLTKESRKRETLKLLRRPSDCLIIVTSRLSPLHLLQGLFPLLGSSCPFVIFSEFLHPLIECYQDLAKESKACRLQLSDCWFREYQVLPLRTHPTMSTSAASGHILAGYKV
eukprot:tig00001107_g7088.t1